MLIAVIVLYALVVLFGVLAVFNAGDIMKEEARAKEDLNGHRVAEDNALHAILDRACEDRAEVQALYAHLGLRYVSRTLSPARVEKVKK